MINYLHVYYINLIVYYIDWLRYIHIHVYVYGTSMSCYSDCYLWLLGLMPPLKMCLKLSSKWTTVHPYPKHKIADQATKIADQATKISVLYVAAAQPQLFPIHRKKKRSVQVFFKQLNYLEPLKTCSVLRIDVVVRHYVFHTAYGL